MDKNLSKRHHKRVHWFLYNYNVLHFLFGFSTSISLVSVVKTTRCTNVSNLFTFEWHSACFGQSFSVRHQEFKTVQTATDTADCLLASRQQYLFEICLFLYVQFWTPDDGPKDHPKHVKCHSKINKSETFVHLLGFTKQIYYDARPYERQIRQFGMVLVW